MNDKQRDGNQASDSTELIPVLEPDVETTVLSEATKKIGGLLGKAKEAARQIKANSMLAKAGEVAMSATRKAASVPDTQKLNVGDAVRVDEVPFLAVPSPKEIRKACKRHAEGSFYFGNEIPVKKLANARISFAIPESERVIARGLHNVWVGQRRSRVW